MKRPHFLILTLSFIAILFSKNVRAQEYVHYKKFSEWPLYSVSSFCFSPDRNTGASRYDEKDSVESIIILWDNRIGKKRHIFTGDTGHAEHVAFSPDGRILASSNSGWRWSKPHLGGRIQL